MVLGIKGIRKTDPAQDLQEQTLVQAYDVLLVDLDGVVYTGAHAIPAATEGLNAAVDAGHVVGFLTNNASRTPETVAEQLQSFGLTTDAAHIVTSPHAAVPLLAKQIDAGAEVLVVGGPGLRDAVAAAGFKIVSKATDATRGVIQGFDPSVAWTDLAEAAYAIANGAVWVGTNSDWTIPRERGIAPGNGTLLSAVHTATGAMAQVAGKPERPIYDAAFERFPATRYLAIGDRLDTDILGGNRAGIDTLLVLTGIDRAKAVLAAVPEQRPTYIVDDLSALHAAYAPAVVDGDVATCGDAEVTCRDAVLRVTQGDPTSVEALRAATALVWTGDRPIWAMDVDAELLGESTRA